MAEKILPERAPRVKRPPYAALEHHLLLTQQALWDLERASGNAGDPITLQRARAAARRILKAKP